jgi:hypothetical protein
MVVYLARRIKMGESAWLTIEAVSPSFRGARKREPGIWRFPDVQLHI